MRIYRRAILLKREFKDVDTSHSTYVIDKYI